LAITSHTSECGLSVQSKPSGRQEIPTLFRFLSAIKISEASEEVQPSQPFSVFRPNGTQFELISD
jgi:hypothetical protein